MRAKELMVAAALVGCHVAPPGPVVPPPVAAPAPAPVVAAIVTPVEPPAPTWDELRAELPGLDVYVPTVHVEPPAWLAEVEGLWLRVGSTCRAISLAATDRGRGALEQCHEKVRKADVTCTRSLELGAALRVTDLEMCSARLPSGDGMGSGWSSQEPGVSGSLVAADEQRLRYASTWQLWVEAERLVWVESECSAASVETLVRGLAAEGLVDAALREALHQRYGVLGRQRRCLEHHGVRLHARRSEVMDRSDRGAEARGVPGVQDCTIGCPDTAAGLRRLNAGLRVRPYARVGDTAAIVVHRSRAGCEAELAGGLPALGESPCRAWYLRGAGG